jgi:hypothetical protein
MRPIPWKTKNRGNLTWETKFRGNLSGRRGMDRVGALLALEVDPRVTPTTLGRRLLFIRGTDVRVRGPRLDQRAVDTNVLDPASRQAQRRAASYPPQTADRGSC